MSSASVNENIVLPMPHVVLVALGDHLHLCTHKLEQGDFTGVLLCLGNIPVLLVGCILCGPHVAVS